MRIPHGSKLRSLGLLLVLESLGFRVKGLRGVGVKGLGFRGLRYRVQGFWVQVPSPLILKPQPQDLKSYTLNPQNPKTLNPLNPVIPLNPKTLTLNRRRLSHQAVRLPRRGVLQLRGQGVSLFPLVSRSFGFRV